MTCLFWYFLVQCASFEFRKDDSELVGRSMGYRSWGQRAKGHVYLLYRLFTCNCCLCFYCSDGILCFKSEMIILL